MTGLDVLIAARALIADPKHWGQGDGHRPGTNCASEAIFRSTKTYDESVAAMIALIETIGGVGNVHIPHWNDSSTHAQVLAAFDKAIATERAKQKPTDISVFHKLLAAELVSA
jgi:hypothetical protein